MAAAFLVIPLVDGHMAVRAFAVLLQHAVALRMAGRAAVYLVEAEEPGALVADAAP